MMKTKFLFCLLWLCSLFAAAQEVCIKTKNLRKTDLTCENVTLSWNPVPYAEAYQLAIRKQGEITTVFPPITETSRILNLSIEAGILIEWSVRTKCVNGLWTDYVFPLKTFTTVDCNATNVDEVTAQMSLTVFPNPTKNDLYVNFMSFSAATINVKAIDILGKTTLAKKVEVLQGENSFILNVEDLPSGTYFLAIENDFERSVEKFIAR